MTDKKEFIHHDIQLEAIKVIELSISVFPGVEQDQVPDVQRFRLYHGHTPYDAENKKFACKIGVEVRDAEEEADEQELPFNLKAEILGVFDVGDNFPEQFVSDFATKNAPLLVYPYLREHVFSLTSKAGFDGMLLPLFQIPVFKPE